MKLEIDMIQVKCNTGRKILYWVRVVPDEVLYDIQGVHKVFA